MSPSAVFDVRADFPFLERTVNGRKIVYFDNAATTQKPREVLECVQKLYCSGIANVHRAVNFLADEVTESFEAARRVVAQFIGAHSREIIFTSSATAGLNLAAGALGRRGPLRVLPTTLEHHSNFLPWMAAGQADFVPWNRDGQIDFRAFTQKLDAHPDLVAITHVSNLLGSVQPVAQIAEECRRRRIPVLVDASQSIPHTRIDVRQWDCDFLVFSGHKIYGPSGIGVLYARNELIDRLDPVVLGGSMVKEVHAQTFTVNDVPFRFEAGTPNIEGVIALASALGYFSRVGYDNIAAHEKRLVDYTKQRLPAIRHLTLYGPPPGCPCAPIATFAIKGLDAGVVAKALAGRANVIVRSGFHCAQPAHDELQIGPTVRASFAMYNQLWEVDAMAETLEALTQLLH